MESILIIDDSLPQAMQLQSILKEDYKTATTQTAEEGFQMVRLGEYSLILLDAVMPGMDGFELLKKLQEEPRMRNVPVIIITSLTASEHEERGLTLGAVDYIVKPFNPLIVKARVNTHIKLYQYRRQVERMSLTDPMTGVSNRRCHDSMSLLKWQDAIRLQVPMSICMMDIDKFKVYNDTFGHPAGDRVITAVARTASGHLRRSTDFFARYGGEEFVAFMLGSSEEEAFAHMQKIRRAVEQLQIPQDPKTAPWVTVSMGGITLVPQVEHSYETYLKIADAMLYDAKRFGRNQVVWSDGKMNQRREK